MRTYDLLDVIVAEVCGVSPEFLHNRCRKTRAINARYILIKLKYELGLSITELAYDFDRSWVQIYYILRRVTLFVAVDKEFATLFHQVVCRVHAPTSPYRASLIYPGVHVIMRGAHPACRLTGVVTSLDDVFFYVESYHNRDFTEKIMLLSGKKLLGTDSLFDVIAIEI